MKKLSSFILFLGVCLSHWTTVTPLKKQPYPYQLLHSAFGRGNDTHVVIRYENITDIREDAFDNKTHLTYLDLSHNGFVELRPRMFAKLENLEELSLRENDITVISRPFAGLNNLKRLDLSYNPGFSFAAGALFGLTNATNIITEKSQIWSISSRSFLNISVATSKLEASEEFSEESKEKSDGKPPSLYNPHVKICKTDNGLVTSIEELKSNETIGNCTAAIVDVENKVLNLTDLGLKEFQQGWYQLSGNFFKVLDLSSNLITDITPELLNDLPSNLTDFCFDHNKIRVIKRNTIENRFIEKLSFSYNPLSKIEDGTFEKTNLIHLIIGETKLENISFVTTLPTTIEELELFRNPITEIPVNTFRGLTNLVYIRINNTNIDKIESGTFEDQENLYSLILGNNQIKSLNRGIFKGLKSLAEISFQNNSIEKISRETFSELRNLSDLTIFLDNNRINIIEKGSFSGMNISFLSLGFNNITNDSIEKGTFNNSIVKGIYMGNNWLTKVNGELFDGIVSFYDLDLSENQIKTIKKGDVEGMDMCLGIDLHANPLKRLENGALRGLSKERDVDVALHDCPITLVQGGIFD